MDNVLEQLTAFAATSGVKVVGAIVILIVGRIVAGAVRRAVRRVMTRRNVDPSLVGFTGSLVYLLIIAFVWLAVLGQFGVETASFVAFLGAAGFAIGFALQGSLSNFAAGVMLLVFRPFKVGDVVDAAGVVGKVLEIQLFNTILVTADNVRITVPNGKIYGDTIKNITAHDTRRVDIMVGIGYGSDIQKAMDVTMGLVKADPRVLPDPAPMVAVVELADSSVNLTVRPWARTGDYWDLKFDLTRAIKEAFDANGIEIPFPQRVVHIIGQAETRA